MYPAHLATLNLAAREINEEANYPRIVRRNFFDFEPPEPFCSVPGMPASTKTCRCPGWTPWSATRRTSGRRRWHGKTSCVSVRLAAAPGAIWLSGRSDLHCYFWPAATRLLKPDGYFGFSDQFVLAGRGVRFRLQGWMLRHFRVLAVMESAAEPWFEDARVKTCVTVLQRCDHEAERMANRVRFVRFYRKLAEIIGLPPGQDEDAGRRLRTAARRILEAEGDRQDEDLRIIVKAQAGPLARRRSGRGDLWATSDVAGPPTRPKARGGKKGIAPTAMETAGSATANGVLRRQMGPLCPRPGPLFRGHAATSASVCPAGRNRRSAHRGINSGCDAFFMPRDITAAVLARHQTDREFRRNAGRRTAKRGRIGQAADRQGR